jgi:predicted phosphodiesterase
VSSKEKPPKKPSESLKDRLATVRGEAELTDVTRDKHTPPGWEPGVVWDGTEGTITADPIDSDKPNWDKMLLARGLNPEVYEVAEDVVKFSSWDGANGERKFSFKATIQLKRSASHVLQEDVYRGIRKAKKVKHKPPSGSCHFVVALSDWQVGNRDGGGMEEQARKIANLVDLIPQRIADLRKMGYKIGHVVVAGMGDLAEGTCGFYPAQEFRIEADRRDQMKLVRRGLTDIIKAIAPIAPKVTVLTVGGNHGENRAKGKAFTTTGDNDDVAVFEPIAEAFQENTKAYGHVGFKIPRDQLSLSISLAGHIVAFTHGHLSRPSQNAAQSLWVWWQKQAMGRAHPGVADANILITGHYHHLNVKEQEGRALFICPSLTTVGEYFQDGAGVKTQPGTLTMTVDESGWGNLHLIN